MKGIPQAGMAKRTILKINSGLNQVGFVTAVL